MGKARRRAIDEAHLSKLRAERFARRQTLPGRLLKSFVNVLCIVPILIILAAAQGIERDEWIWEKL